MCHIERLPILLLVSMSLLQKLSRSQAFQAGESMMSLGRRRQRSSSTPWMSQSRKRSCTFHSTLHTLSSSEEHEKMIQYQSSISTERSKSLSQDEQEHLLHQQSVFDSMSEWFADREKEVTPDLEPIYQTMAKTMLQKLLPSSDVDSSSLSILDVACGTGVLWEFLIDAANESNLTLAIRGVDLSPSMVSQASKRAKCLLEHQAKRKNENSSLPSHTIDVVESDVVKFCRSIQSQEYNGVIVNACFGNFWDPRLVLEALPGPSAIAISHPLGAAFVQQLHDQDPKTVPHLLPSSTLSMVQRWTFALPILPTYFTETPYYLMILEKQRRRAKPLTVLQRYRGTVDEGYGRGGKKLGVPTANLPSSLFQNALQDIDTGVYFGWATLEHLPNQFFKAVVNVGYSPTFEGQENKEKIIEAHLMDESLPDFYGQVMRLQLSGYLRAEQKFDSFPELVTQIHADIKDARDALDLSPFCDLRADPFLTSKDWSGNGGGDDIASWEFVDHLQTLTTMVESDN